MDVGDGQAVLVRPDEFEVTEVFAADPGSQRSSATSSTPRAAARTSVTSKSSGRTITASLVSTAALLA